MSAPRSSTYDPSARGPDARISRSRLRRSFRAGLIGIFALAAIAVAAPTASAAPFACTTGTIFLSQGPPTGGTQLNALEYGAGQTQFRPIGPPYTATTYNALAFNPNDNFLYAIDIDPGGGPKSLFRIHDDGSVQSFPLPALEQLSQFHAGAFDDSGNYYVAQNGDPNNGLFQIDVATQAVTRIQLSGTVNVSDFTFADGFLWGIATDAGGALTRINPTTGQIDSFPQTAVPGPYTDPSTGFGLYGANWTYGNGNLGFSNNQTGQVTQVELSNPGGTPTLQRVSLAAGPASALNDGAMCPGLPTDLVVEKSGPPAVAPGAQVTWTITVTNSGPGGSSGYTIDDTLPAQIANPQTSTPGCTISGQDLQCVLGMLPAGDSVDVEVTGTMPSAVGTCVSNAVSVIGNELDPNPDNNNDDTRTCTAIEFDCATGTTFVSLDVPTQLYENVYGAGSSSFQSIGGPSPQQYNGLAFNESDQLIYAYGFDTDTLLQINGDGSVNDVGAIAGLPAANYFAGAFDDAGNYYLTIGNMTGTIVYQIDLATRVATPITTSQPFAAPDMAFVDGYFWGLAGDGPNSGQLLRFDPSTGQVDAFPQTAVSTATGGAGIAWTFGNGNLGFASGAGQYYQVSLSDPSGTPSLTLVSVVSGPSTAAPNGDGTSCAGEPTDLEVEKTGPPQAAPGGQVTWTITVTNNGPGGSSGYTIDDTLPAEIGNPQTSSPGCTISGQDLQCVLGVLPAGDSAQVQVTGTMPSTGGTCVTNAVAVIGNEIDPNPDNNTDDVGTCTPPPPPPPPSSNVTIDKTASAPRVRVGDSVTYTMVATNNGPGVAPDVRVSDPVPSQLDAGSASTAQGTCTVTGNQVACTLGTMAVGQSVTITVEAVANRVGDTTNTATVTSPRCTTTPCDSDPAEVKIRKPRLGLTKGVNKKRIRAGQKVTYTIRTRNPSNTTLRRVRTCDDLPPGLVFVKAKPKAKLSKGKYCWTAKRLRPGQRKTYKLTARATQGIRPGKKVNRATAKSPDAKTKRAKRTIRVRGAQVRGGGVTG